MQKYYEILIKTKVKIYHNLEFLVAFLYLSICELCAIM